MGCQPIEKVQGTIAGAASEAAELRKHTANDEKCVELGSVSIPLVVESYGAWGKEAQQCLTCILPKSMHGNHFNPALGTPS